MGAEVITLPSVFDKQNGLARLTVFCYEFACPDCKRRYYKKLKIKADDFDYKLRTIRFRCLTCHIKVNYTFKLGIQVG